MMSVTTADEEWVKAAMSDDAMVVDLLVRLHRPNPKPNPLFPLHWTVRQRRSRSTSLTTNKKKLISHRNSPTTPLSWSGGATSLSAGSGGFEESSQPSKLPDTTRSKVNCENDKTPSKRPRKKKTLAQLKEEENLLVKERRDLNKEITALRMKLERERATNNSLKRIKLTLKPEPDREVLSQEESVSGTFMPCTMGTDIAQSSASNSGLEQNADARFVLPDLNMPFDDSSPDVICGAS